MEITIKKIKKGYSTGVTFDDNGDENIDGIPAVKFEVIVNDKHIIPMTQSATHVVDEELALKRAKTTIANAIVDEHKISEAFAFIDFDSMDKAEYCFALCEDDFMSGDKSDIRTLVDVSETYQHGMDLNHAMVEFIINNLNNEIIKIAFSENAGNNEKMDFEQIYNDFSEVQEFKGTKEAVEIRKAAASNVVEFLDWIGDFEGQGDIKDLQDYGATGVPNLEDIYDFIGQLKEAKK